MFWSNQSNDLLENAILLQLLQILEHVDLFLAQPQVVTIGHILGQFRMTAGQVSTLTAGAGQHHQRHIAIVCPGALQSIGILFPGHFIDAVLRLIAAGGIGNFKTEVGQAAGEVTAINTIFSVIIIFIVIGINNREFGNDGICTGELLGFV